MVKMFTLLKNPRFIIVIICLFVLFVIFNMNPYKETHKNYIKNIIKANPPTHSANRCQIYKNECLALYEKLRNPSKSLLFDPPLNKIPDNLLKEFLQDGNMKLSYQYINDLVYHKDAAGDTKNNYTQLNFKQLENADEVMKGNVRFGAYKLLWIAPLLNSYSNEIKVYKH